MKLSEKFPDAKPDDVLKLPGESILRIDKTEPCFRCGAETQFVGFSFEQPVCSTDCLDATWKEVFSPPKTEEKI